MIEHISANVYQSVQLKKYKRNIIDTIRFFIESKFSNVAIMIPCDIDSKLFRTCSNVFTVNLTTVLFSVHV